MCYLLSLTIKLFPSVFKKPFLFLTVQHVDHLGSAQGQ